MERMRNLGVSFATAMSAASCVPYAIPPLTVAVGPAHAREEARTGLRAEAGLAPMQLVQGQLHRRWDARVMGTYEHQRRSIWGVALAAGPILHPWGPSHGNDGSRRLLPMMVARWTDEGSALGVRAGFEWAKFVHGTFSGRDATGSGHGETAIGFYLDAEYQTSDRVGDGWSLGAGLSLRVPAMVGLACCVR